MRITVVQGDITEQDVDAIVNAANSTLLGGGGVDGAIHAAAGPKLLRECRELREAEYPDGLPTGQAAVTPAGKLPADHVIHTVGPNRHAGQTDPALLASCFRESLNRAVQVGDQTVAFPAVGAGAYGWDAEEVARVARSVLGEAHDGWSDLDEVRFVLHDAGTTEVFRNVFEYEGED
ncbi:O-acetyl-ADP-ribose deacetylase [Sediminivirga luteola]|jgi:O-acetyl-ADP-ribose deacetylase (regulator of RNase III)|uniref:O-acetyl-ADP-ribose deacetylase n=1 Tax=Sediminivirga luteola TaxID=1774748 RepID=A0A8J2XE73_9MICO|nr:O-acetyl-ADP-ribose deacetylase [Sediminivirga luteola]MCI2265723.1 O-acetyl-ADP-ribose deacetylase [Sediminivirga luteola]GGA07141.1 O-acetyl-ADP-ribose deacetylase [Sediminivirga luteola]